MRALIISSTSQMEPDEFDPFAVYKRARPADMAVEDSGRKMQHTNEKASKAAEELREKIDPMALL